MADMTPQQTDDYYASLFGESAGVTGGASAGVATKGGRLGGLKGVAKRVGPELIGWLLLEKFLKERHQSKLRDIQIQGMRGQAEAMSPESLYYQAALPQAQEEEAMARTALMTHLTGGVLGPQLARGEIRIGGR